MSAPKPAIAAPFIKAREDVKLDPLIVELTPFSCIAPPVDSEIHEVNEESIMVALFEFLSMYIAPPFGEKLSEKVVLNIYALFPIQSIAPPRPTTAFDT